jgi:hypothetical protein
MRVWNSGSTPFILVWFLSNTCSCHAYCTKNEWHLRLRGYFFHSKCHVLACLVTWMRRKSLCRRFRPSHAVLRLNTLCKLHSCPHRGVQAQAASTTETKAQGAHMSMLTTHKKVSNERAAPACVTPYCCMRRVARCMACCFSAELPPWCSPKASAFRMRSMTASLTADFSDEAPCTGLLSCAVSITSATFFLALLSALIRLRFGPQLPGGFGFSARCSQFSHDWN